MRLETGHHQPARRAFTASLWLAGQLNGVAELGPDDDGPVDDADAEALVDVGELRVSGFWPRWLTRRVGTCRQQELRAGVPAA
jgi:hypothetical protein